MGIEDEGVGTWDRGGGGGEEGWGQRMDEEVRTWDRSRGGGDRGR